MLTTVIIAIVGGTILGVIALPLLLGMVDPTDDVLGWCLVTLWVVVSTCMVSLLTYRADARVDPTTKATMDRQSVVLRRAYEVSSAYEEQINRLSQMRATRRR